MTVLSQTMPRRWQLFFAVLKALALVLLIAYLIRQFVQDTALLAPLATGRGLAHLGLAALWCAASLMCVGFRHLVLVRSMYGTISAFEVFRVFAAGVFANNVLPAATGFDVLRLYAYSKRSGLPIATIVKVILADRISTVAGLASFAVLAQFLALLTGLPHPLRNLSPNSGILVSSLCLVFLLSVAVAFIGPKYSTQCIGFLASRFRSLDGNSAPAAAHSTCSLALALLLSMGTHFFAALGIATLALGLFGIYQARLAFTLSPLVFFSALVPITPAGIGWTEAIADLTWTLYSATGGLILFSIWRIVSLAISLLGATAYFQMRATHVKPEEGTP